jgi:hypothetical protein
MTRKIFPPLFVLVLAILACSFQSVTPAPSSPAVPTATLQPPKPTDTLVPTANPGLTVEMLRNGSYHGAFFDRTFDLVDGAYSNGSATDPYSVRMLDVYALGDLNGDGAGDAAIILVENTGGTGQFESLVVVLNMGGAAVQAGQVPLGDRVRINSVAIEAGAITLDMVVPGPNDPMCCPSQPETQTYRMVESSLWLTRLTSRTPTDQERSLTVLAPAEGAEVTNPFTINGSVTIAPFENTLACHILLPDGTKVNEFPLMVDSGGEMGAPGTFTHTFDLGNAGITGPVIFQFLDISAADGSTLALGSVLLNIK